MGELFNQNNYIIKQRIKPQKMSDYLSAIKKDFREYAFEGKKLSMLAKAIDDGKLSLEEYQALKHEYTGSKTGEEAVKAEAEFHAAMASTFGESVNYLKEKGTVPISLNILKLEPEIVAVDNNITITDGVKSIVARDDSEPLAERAKNDKKAIYMADALVRATDRIPPDYKEVYETLKDLREMAAKGQISPVILEKTELNLKETLKGLVNKNITLYKKEQKEALGLLLGIEPPLMPKDSEIMIQLYKKLRDEKTPVINIGTINNKAKVDLNFKGSSFLNPGVNGIVPLFYGSMLPPANGTSLSVPLPMSLLSSDSISLGPVVNAKGVSGFGGSLTYGKVDVNVSFHQTRQELNGMIPAGFVGGVSVVMPLSDE